jgi:hypothetical protein
MLYEISDSAGSVLHTENDLLKVKNKYQKLVQANEAERYVLSKVVYEPILDSRMNKYEFYICSDFEHKVGKIYNSLRKISTKEKLHSDYREHISFNDYKSKKDGLDSIVYEVEIFNPIYNDPNKSTKHADYFRIKRLVNDPQELYSLVGSYDFDDLGRLIKHQYSYEDEKDNYIKITEEYVYNKNYTKKIVTTVDKFTKKIRVSNSLGDCNEYVYDLLNDKLLKHLIISD